MQQIYLKPGEYYFGDQPARIVTVLGSCVAMSLYHRNSGLATICHTLAPDCGAQALCPAECVYMHRYVNCMIPAMVRSFLTRGIKLPAIEAKLFGGAAMNRNTDDHGSLHATVGAMNVEAAQKLIHQYGLELQSADVGGHCGRKIIFDTGTGDILLKLLRAD